MKKFKDTSKINKKKQSLSNLRNKSCKDMSKIFRPKSQNSKKNFSTSIETKIKFKSISTSSKSNIKNYKKHMMNWSKRTSKTWKRPDKIMKT